MISLLILSVVLIATLMVMVWLLKTKRMTMPFLYQYNPGYTIGVARVHDPLHIDVENVNVLYKKQFNLHPEPKIMADPFIVKDDNMFYIFYEEFTGKYRHFGGADIGLLSSEDGERWKRVGIVLHEPFHLSFPNVFLWKGEWYMIPEADASRQLRLYKATNFPTHWQCIHTYNLGRYADPMIYIKGDIVYLWINSYLEGDNLRLLYSDNLLQDWKEHPCSPIRTKGNDTRPAGTINAIHGELLYWVQSSAEGYGTGSIAYKINNLSTSDYLDERLEDNPILWKFGEGWAKDGMHHLSVVPVEDDFLCAMDGLHASLEWRIDWKNWPVFNLKKE